MKKYDIFTINNELDILEIRLNILNDYVDYFVIIEATETFSGHPKPLYYNMNKDRFSNFSDKIIHYIIYDTPSDFNDTKCDQEILNMACNSDNVTREHLCWLKEFYQKEMIKKALVDIDDDDVCYISDIDEIWNFNIKYEILDDIIYKPMINNCYLGYLDIKTDEKWTPETNPFTGPIITKYKNIKNECLNHLRTLRKTKYSFIEDGGWHFNAIGGIDKKINDFKHPVYTPYYMMSRQNGARVDDSDIPNFLKENKERYINLFYKKNK